MLSFFLGTMECAQVIVPEATQEAMRYYQSGNILWIIGLLWGLLLPILFLITGVSKKLSLWGEKWGRNWFFSLSIYLILFIVLYQLVCIPLDFYAEYVREHAYGLSQESVGGWFSGYCKGSMVALIGALAFVWIFYLLLKKSPQRWWFYSSIVASCIMIFTALIQPIWIDPLFNNFGPMKDKALEKQILQLAARAGITDGRVFEVDKSSETKTLNAYVIGVGSTNRIVLWDTTIQAMTPHEILFVMGHEMGHYVLHHIYWDMLYSIVLTFITFYLVYRSATFLMRKYQNRFGFHALHNIASFPLFLLLFAFFSFLSLPLSNYVSRIMEHQADQFGLEITQNNTAAAHAFLVLQKTNLSNPNPGPIYTLFQGSHPSLAQRVAFCNSYCPWRHHEPLKYEKYFCSP